MRVFVSLMLLLLANVVWGSSYVVVKMALEELPPALLAGARYTLASLVLWIILGLRKQRAMPTGYDAARLLALGAIGVSGSGLLVFWGISLTSATDASFMIVGEVLFTTVLAGFITRSKLGVRRGIGLTMGLMGVVILITGSNNDAFANWPAHPLGDVLILAGLGLEAVYTVVGATLARRYDPLTVVTVTLSGSCVIWVPLIAYFLASSQAHAWSPAAVGGVVYLAVLNSVVCYLIWFGVLKTVGATLGAWSLLAQPVVGAFLGIFALGDPVLPSTLVGGTCVLASLALAAFTSRPAYRCDL
jgi:drug/metabolite transporter (DMT)-like permease